LACGGGGAITKVQGENNGCRDVDEKKKSWEKTMFPCHTFPLMNVLKKVTRRRCIKSLLKKSVAKENNLN
jgi:hypothetical protein